VSEGMQWIEQEQAFSRLMSAPSRERKGVDLPGETETADCQSDAFRIRGEPG